MLIHTPPIAMREQVLAWRAAGEAVAFVPTMGALHEGHMSLVRAARARAERVVVSIFVNPTQFGPNEDFATYPRTPEQDLARCRDATVDAVFTPTAEAMYPPSAQTWVEVPELAHGLCGPFRPGHFRGVATVVYTLFWCVPADCAIFGEKDYQQLKVIERMTHDLHLPIRIVGMPTVREPDGLAMSSRNQYLAPKERAQAPAIYRALQTIARRARETRDVPALIAAGRAVLDAAGITTIQYLAIVDADTLAPLTALDPQRPARCCLAAYVGPTRLIDNMSIAL